MNNKVIYAVLTGDLVGSTKISNTDLADARAVVESAMEETSRWGRGIVKGKPEFFRGDSWQALLSEPRFALRAAFLVRARLIASKTADSRIAIGIGGVDRISRARVSLSTGSAFIVSGRALDKIGRVRLTIVADDLVRSSVGALCDWLPAIGGAADGLVSGWTVRQAAMVALALRLPTLTQDAIASELGVSSQTVSKALDAAHWRALKGLIEHSEMTSW